MSGRVQSGSPISDELNKAIDVLAAKIAAEVRVLKEKSSVFNTGNNATSVNSANPIAVEDYARPFLDFLNGNPTVFHATKYFSDRLDAQGFVRLSEKQDWVNVNAGGKYYVTRNGSSLVAFSIPEKYRPGNGVAMIAGHIDALTAKLKPNSKKPVVEGYVQIGVAPYGGSMENTWWDRDLGIAGRVVVKNPDGKIETKLVNLDWPVGRISTLAVHFGAPSKGPFNKETQMTPVIGLEGPDDDQSTLPEGSFAAGQPARLVKIVASQLGIQDISSILSWELEMFQCEPGTFGGLSREFIFAPRIDDKLCSWAAIEGLILASKDLSDRGTINMCALYDNEETGSESKQGAKSNLMSNTISRIVEAFSQDGAYKPSILSRTYANSFLVSADVTHAVNNNFVNAYLPGHMPHLNVGLAMKMDPNGHVTTDSVSSSLLKQIAEKVGHKLQIMHIRNDGRSGGTVGPMLSAAMGVRSIDVGLPELSMHSIRSATGARDPGLGVQMFAAFYQYYEEVDKAFTNIN